MIDKSLRMKVPKQGGVKNYLGKQKMVTAPKKWKSAPNHPDTELAYITKAEKDALIKINLHGSMNGKAHKGPSGIISLNGWGDADRGYDSPSSGGGHGGSDGNDYEWEAYNPPAPAPAPAPSPVDYSSLDNEEQAAVDRGEPTAQMTPTERNEQGYGPGGTDNPDYKLKQFEETGDIDELADFTGIDTSVKTDIADIHGEWDDPDSVTFAGTDARGNILYDPAAQAAATRKAIAESKPAFWDSGIGKTLKVGATILAPPIATKLGVGEAYRLGKLGYDIKQRKGTYGTALKFLEKKTGKEFKIPGTDDKPREINLLDEFGYKGNVYAKKPTVQRDDENRDDLAQTVSGQQDVISKAVNQFRGTKVEDQISSLVTNNLNRALQFYAQMTPMIEAGKASRQEMDAYELLGFYLNKQNQAMRGGSTYI